MDKRQEMAQKILDTLHQQKFADWYSQGQFDKYITGEDQSVTKEQILEAIIKLFHL